MSAADIYTIDWAERLWRARFELGGKPIPADDLLMMLNVYRSAAISRSRTLDAISFELSELSERASAAAESGPEVVQRNGRTLYRRDGQSDESEDV